MPRAPRLHGITRTTPRCPSLPILTARSCHRERGTFVLEIARKGDALHRSASSRLPCYASQPRLSKDKNLSVLRSIGFRFERHLRTVQARLHRFRNTDSGQPAPETAQDWTPSRPVATFPLHFPTHTIAGLQPMPKLGECLALVPVNSVALVLSRSHRYALEA